MKIARLQHLIMSRVTITIHIDSSILTKIQLNLEVHLQSNMKSNKAKIHIQPINSTKYKPKYIPLNIIKIQPNTITYKHSVQQNIN